MQILNINKIVFTGDIFRTHKLEPNQIYNVVNILEVFGPVLKKISNLPVFVGYWGLFLPSNIKPNSQILIESYRILNSSPDLFGWAANFWSAADKCLVDLLRNDYSESLVIGFELSPLMESLLNQIDCAWINISQSPLRFFNQPIYSFRSSNLINFDFVNDLKLSDEYINDRVFELKALYGSRSLGLNNSILFCAQTTFDRAMITDHGFYSIDETLNDLSKHISTQKVFVKAHPLEHNPVTDAIVKSFNATPIQGSLIPFFCSQDRFDLVAVSSSTLSEAVAFGKKAIALSPLLSSRYPVRTSLALENCGFSFWKKVSNQIIN